MEVYEPVFVGVPATPEKRPYGLRRQFLPHALRTSANVYRMTQYDVAVNVLRGPSPELLCTFPALGQYEPLLPIALPIPPIGPFPN